MSESGDPRELAEQLGAALRAYMLLIKGAIIDQPVTRQQLELLAALMEGPCRVTDLAAVLGVRMPTVTTQLARLERDGLVARGPGEGDARIVMVSMTADGRRMLGHGLELWFDWLTDRLKRLSPAELASLEAAAPAFRKLFSRSAAGQMPDLSAVVADHV